MHPYCWPEEPLSLRLPWRTVPRPHLAHSAVSRYQKQWSTRGWAEPIYQLTHVAGRDVIRRGIFTQSEQIKDGSDIGCEAPGEERRRTTKNRPEPARDCMVLVRLPVDSREALALAAEVPIVVPGEVG